MLFICLLWETLFSSRGEPWCFVVTMPQIFTQDRRLEVARGLPDPLTYQMFYFWKSQRTQWQQITHVSHSTALPQVRATKSNRGGLTWKLHTPLAGTAVFNKTPGFVEQRTCAKEEPSCQVSCAACSDSTPLSSGAGCSLHFLRGTPSYLEQLLFRDINNKSISCLFVKES